MPLFDFPPAGAGNDIGSLLSQFVGAGVSVYNARLAAQQAKRMTRGGVAQQPGWGGSSASGWAPAISAGGSGPINMAPLFSDEEVRGGIRGVFGLGPDEIEGEYSVVNTRTGAVREKRARTHPADVTVTGTDGKTYRYKSEGRALLSTLDMSGYRKVCRVAHELLGGPKPKATRRAKRRKGCKPKRRKVACRTLTPKQLAAGFGGAQYRR